MTGDPRFHTTRWSVIVAAGGTPSERGTHDALETLCRGYWYPVFAFIRRGGRSDEDALDLTQGFFASLLEKGLLRVADRDRGRFRSFLLATVKQFLSDERKRESTLKRGRDVEFITLGDARREDRDRALAAPDESPEEAFDRDWALTILRRALARIEAEFTGRRRAEELRLLRPHVVGDGQALPYAEIAEHLGVTESAVKSAVVRLRRRLGALLREEIGHTLSVETDLDAELRHLLSSL